MDDSAIERFFREPAGAIQRKFEVLRAVFLEHRSLKEVAQQFSYSYGSVRNLVSTFRTPFATGEFPPFSYQHLRDGRAATRRTTPNRKLRRLPTSDFYR